MSRADVATEEDHAQARESNEVIVDYPTGMQRLLPDFADEIDPDRWCTRAEDANDKAGFQNHRWFWTEALRGGLN